MKTNIMVLFLFLTLSIYSENNLTIKGMRSFEYPLNPIKVEKVIEDNEKFKSEDVSFNVNGIKQYALLSTPKAQMPKNGYPVILLIHGHIPPKQYSTLNSYKYMFGRFALSEFAVIKPDLRGHGRSEINSDFDQNLSKLYYVEDVLQLLSSLKTLDNIDINNVFILGHSNGGDLALRLLVIKPKAIKGAILWAPVSVLMEESNFFYKGQGKGKFGLEALKKEEAKDLIINAGKVLDNSLLNIGITNREDIRYYKYLKEITTPIIIRHPDTDQSVPYYWSEEFKNKFIASGNLMPLEIFNYPGDNHNIANNQRQAQLDDLKWFRSLMK